MGVEPTAGDHSRPALWRYLQERPNVDPGAPLFLSGDGPMTRSWLRKRLVILGERAGVAGVYPHRFRHTFAVQYLRNGGDVFTLQALLGHSSLAMVQHYLRLAQADVEHAHRRASPVDLAEVGHSSLHSWNNRATMSAVVSFWHVLESDGTYEQTAHFC